MVVRKTIDYWRALLAYLPRGIMWQQMRATEGYYSDGVPKPYHWFSRLLCGIAETLAWLDGQIFDRLIQAWPTLASADGLSLWEQVLWGAKQISYWSMTLERRRKLVLGWLALPGIASIEHWKTAAKKYGVNANIYNGPWRLFYTIESGAITRFKAGDKAGESLLTINRNMTNEWDFLTTAWYCRVAGCGIWWAHGSDQGE